MKPANRRTEIVKMVRQRNRITVDELAAKLHISRETVRRDLTMLAKTGEIQKYHGGASLPTMLGEGPFLSRMGKNTEAKVLIAEEAVKLVIPGETLFIDTGSTTLYFAEKLAKIPDLTVVTNSAEIARTISIAPLQSKVFLLGGEFSADNRQTFGSLAISQIHSFRAHHAILAVGALDSQTGVMDFNINEAQVAQAMLTQAESLTILVDSSKFEKIASFEVCELERITNLVCEQPPPDEIKEALLKAKVNICCAAV
ncbi:MAG: DeoR/GlpR transcriptional regulator [SAR324 cluster bacterium]|nr:DeoR/GlpR transcriptional regulator [SAR324 cluster bacterium]MBL7034969.1 DeoR/GlpR transcriptional regulator [SAR324 cluster bacterium]